MVAGIDWTRWSWGIALALMAAPMGLLAGFDPNLAATLALAIAFTAIAFSDLSSGLALYIFASFFALHPYGLHDVLARLVLALAWFAVIATRRRSEIEFPAVHPVVAAALVLFVAWSALSVTWAQDSGEALASTERYALSAILFLIVFTAVRSRDDLGRLLLALVLGAAAATVYGLISPPVEDTGRLTSTVLDSNLLAAALVSGLALTVAVIALYRAPSLRLTAFAATLLFAVGVWMTTSRSALIALVLCLVAAIAVAGRWRVPVLAAAIVVAAATYAYFDLAASEEAKERITEPFSGEERSLDGRTTIWGLAWRAFEDKPLAGVGSGNFPIASPRYLLEPGVERTRDQVLDAPEGRVAHSSYLSVLSELGLIGLALFAFVIAFSLSSMLRAARLFDLAGQRRMQVAALSVAVALLGILAVNFFQSDQQSKQLWLLLGLGPALLSIARAPGTKSAR